MMHHLSEAFDKLARVHAKAVVNDTRRIDELLRLLRSDKAMDVVAVGWEAADVIEYLLERDR